MLLLREKQGSQDNPNEPVCSVTPTHSAKDQSPSRTERLLQAEPEVGGRMELPRREGGWVWVLCGGSLTARPPQGLLVEAGHRGHQTLADMSSRSTIFRVSAHR